MPFVCMCVCKINERPVNPHTDSNRMRKTVERAHYAYAVWRTNSTPTRRLATSFQPVLLSLIYLVAAQQKLLMFSKIYNGF